MEAVPLCVFYQCRRVIKPERVIIEHRRHKASSIMDHKISRGVRQQGKAESVRFGKAIIGESLDTRNYIFLDRFGNISRGHSHTQLFADGFEFYIRPFESHCFAIERRLLPVALPALSPVHYD